MSTFSDKNKDKKIISDRPLHYYNPPLKTNSTAFPHHLEAQQPKVTHLVF